VICIKRKNPAKTLSPGAMTARRFLRNRLAVAGLVILAVMFLFSFLGGMLTPYRQDQVFYRREIQRKEIAAVSQNTSFRFLIAPGEQFGAVEQAQFNLKKDDFTWQDTAYTVVPSGADFYSIYREDTLVAAATRDILHGDFGDFSLQYGLLSSYAAGKTGYGDYTIRDGKVFFGGQEEGYISRLVISGNDLPLEF